MTRAKRASAALGGADELSEGIVKKAIQTKKASTGTLNGTQGQRRRAALTNISNIDKSESGEGKAVKKQATNGRAALVSKTTNAGVQKVSRANSRSALSSKDGNLKRSASTALDPKRSAGQHAEATVKRRATASSSSETVKEKSPATEVETKPSFAVEVERQTVEAKKETIHIEGVKTETMPEVEIAEQMVEVIQEAIPDLDQEDLGDPLMVAEYAVEIFDYLRELELTTMPQADYIMHQDQIDWADRDVLNDWLVQVHQRFQLLPETLYLAINILDRYLSCKYVDLERLQLIGVTALFIASKYEEVLSPHVSNFSYMAKDYQDEEILTAERVILKALDYNLSYPNPMNFLRRISKADNYDIQTRTIGKYLLEISILDHRFLEFAPSHIAAASMYMSRLILQRGEWVCCFQHISKTALANSLIGWYPVSLLWLYRRRNNASFRIAPRLL